MGIGRCAGKWNTIQNPETDPHRHDHLIFDKVAKVIVWSKVFSSTNTTGAIGYPDRKKKCKSLPLPASHAIHKH